MKDRNRILLVLGVCVLLIGAMAYFAPEESEGAVAVSGQFQIAGIGTAITSGTVTFYDSELTKMGSDTITTASGYDINLNPDSYSAVWEVANYYPHLFSIDVPTGIAGTRTYQAPVEDVMPISAAYTVTFGNSTNILATKTNAAQSDITLSTGTTAQTYSLVITNTDNYSSLGLPEVLNYPNRESVYNYVMVSLDTSNAVSTNAALKSDDGKKFFFPVDGVIAGVNSEVGSTSIGLEFTAAGSYTISITLYVFTNLTQLDKYETGTAPEGFTLTSYTIGTAMTLTVT